MDDIYRDALLAQNSGSVIGVAFRLSEMVEVMKGGGPELVAHNPAVRVLIARLAWLAGLGGIKNTEAYFAALDDCLGQLDEEDQEEVLELMQGEALRRILDLG